MCNQSNKQLIICKGYIILVLYRWSMRWGTFSYRIENYFLICFPFWMIMVKWKASNIKTNTCQGKRLAFTYIKNIKIVSMMQNKLQTNFISYFLLILDGGIVIFLHRHNFSSYFHICWLNFNLGVNLTKYPLRRR